MKEVAPVEIQCQSVEVQAPHASFAMDVDTSNTNDCHEDALSR